MGTTEITGNAAILTAVGRALRASRYTPPYRTSTTTLKNRIAAFSASVAPSTAFHSPASTAAPKCQNRSNLF